MRLMKLAGTCSMVTLYDVDYPERLTKEELKILLKKYNSKQLHKAHAIILNLNRKWAPKNRQSFKEKSGFDFVYEYAGFYGSHVETFIAKIKDL